MHIIATIRILDLVSLVSSLFKYHRHKQQCITITTVLKYQQQYNTVHCAYFYHIRNFRMTSEQYAYTRDYLRKSILLFQPSCLEI